MATNNAAPTARPAGDKRSLTRLGSVSSMVTELEIEMLEKKLDTLRDKVKRRGRVVSFVFRIKESLGYVRTVIDAFESQSIRVIHIETRKSRVPEINYDILIDVEANDSIAIQNALAKLDEKICGVEMNEFGLSPPSTPKKLNGITESTTWTNAAYEGKSNLEAEMDGSPWFPHKLEDLDITANRVLMYGPTLDADHPGFKDENYRKRRLDIAEIAYNYKVGGIVPRVEYTAEETAAWGVVYKTLTSLYPTHACKEFLDGFSALQKYCGYSEHQIPQLCDISAFLRERTGFTLRPVAGYLSPRDFLSGLAFRVFHCTQYIRHPSQPLYTPEPDCCHELMGHMAMLLDPAFAQFSQEIGLASLGAPDPEVKKLATCYFFTIEFGLCTEDGKLRAYGAGLLSSASELQHALSPSAEVLPFDPKTVAEQECLITTFQNRYFCTRTFEDAKEKMREFAKTIQRPFTVRFNPYTQAIEVLDSARSIEAVVSEMKGDVAIISNALQLICSKRK